MSFVCCVARAQHAYVEHMYVCKSNTIKKLIDEIKEKPIYAQRYMHTYVHMFVPL